MKLAFQNTEIEDRELELTVSALTSLGIDYEGFDLPYFASYIPAFFEEPTILFGSTKLMKLCDKNTLPKNAIVYHINSNFDQATYSKYIGNHLINGCAEYNKFMDVLDMVFDEPRFIKPPSDTKLFPGFCVGPECACRRTPQ